MTTVLASNTTEKGLVLYMALELSNKQWKLGFSNGRKRRHVTIESGNLIALNEQIGLARAKLGLLKDCRLCSCYEAGRDGFWIHRTLEAQGIENVVVDSSSIEVNRRKRRVKSDKVDVNALLRLLQRYCGGEREVMSVVRVPSIEEEDNRRLNRERERLLKERGAHISRMKSLLVAHGIRLEIRADFLQRLVGIKAATGDELGADLKAELEREYVRYRLAADQIGKLESAQKLRAKEGESSAMKQVNALMMLKGVGCARSSCRRSSCRGRNPCVNWHGGQLDPISPDRS